MTRRTCRRVGIALGAVLVAAACSAAPTDVVVGAEVAPQSPAPTPDDEINADTTSPTTVPAGDHLLTNDDLPGWNVSPPEASPGRNESNTTDCPLLDPFFDVVNGPGERVYGGNGSVTSLTNGVVALESVDAGSNFMNGLDTVWEPCVILTTLDGEELWLEPLALPPVEGWRTAGLAFGGQQSLVFYGFWQRDDTAVYVELDGGVDLYQQSEPVFTAMAARLSGQEPTIAPPEPSPTPVPAETTIELPVVPIDPGDLPDDIAVPDLTFDEPEPEKWTEHPLAPLVLEPSEIGEFWVLARVDINDPSVDEGEPVDQVCGADEPPTLDGLEPEFESTRGGRTELEQILARGTPDTAQTWLTVLRALVGCPVEETGGPAEFVLIERTISGADDSVCIEAVDLDPQADEPAFVALCAARYDNLLVGMHWAASVDSLDAPTVAQVGDLIEQVAARR